MKITRWMYFLILCSLLVFSQAISAQQYKNYDRESSSEISSLEFDDAEYSESTFRRGDILFFLSFPFVFAANLALVATVNALSANAPFEFNTSSWLFIGSSSLLLTGGIIYSDYRQHREDSYAKSKRKDQGDSIFVSYQFRY